MHSVLLVICKPASPDAQQQRIWQSIRQRAKEFAQESEDFEILGENVFLLRLHSGLSLLSRLVEMAETLEHRALFFEQEPAWVTSS